MAKTSKKIQKFSWKNFLGLTFAGIINAFGVNFFLSPVSLYDSGISGLSMFLGGITPDFLIMAYFLIVLNFPLFLFGLKRQGKFFTVYSLYAIAIYSLFSFLFTKVIPIDFSNGSPIAGKDVLLCALFGGLISGVGSGLTIRFGGAIDGIEVMAVTFAKTLGVSVGVFVMGFNVILYTVCGLVLSSWTLPLYSILTYIVGLKAVDFMVEGIDRSKSAMIITTKPTEICNEFARVFGTGGTKMEAKGGFSNENKTVIYFVVNRFQIARVRQIVKSIDNKAYMTITDIADVYKFAK